MNTYGTKPSNLDGILSQTSLDRQERRRKQRTGEFLKGPIPLLWLKQAIYFGKLAVSVGLLLWFRAGCRKSPKDLTVSQRQYQDFGLNPNAFSRGLRKLESAKLVTVERQAGRKPRITLKKSP